MCSDAASPGCLLTQRGLTSIALPRAESSTCGTTISAAFDHLICTSIECDVAQHANFSARVRDMSIELLKETWKQFAQEGRTCGLAFLHRRTRDHEHNASDIAAQMGSGSPAFSRP